MDTLSMLNAARITGKTYGYKDLRYNVFNDFHYINGKPYPGNTFELLNDILKLNWKERKDNEFTREEAEIKFKIKILEE